MKKLLQTIFLMSLSLFTLAQESLLDSANQAYINKDYNSAINQYSKVISQNKVSPEVYYNLGNTYYQKGDYTSAIINYERALRLAPNDEDIKFNLSLANQQIVDKIHPLPQVFIVNWWRGLLGTFSLDQWAWVSVVSFIAFLLFFATYLFSARSRNKRLGFGFGVIAIVFSILSFNFAARHKKELNNQAHAIITQASVTVKSSPSEGGTNVFVIHEGLKVEIIETLGDWYNIKLANGNQGWLEVKSLERI